MSSEGEESEDVQIYRLIHPTYLVPVFQTLSKTRLGHKFDDETRSVASYSFGFTELVTMTSRGR